MKKTIYLFIFLCIASGLVHAQSMNDGIPFTLQLDDDELSKLGLPDRILIYDKLKLDTAVPTVMNGLIGFGSGSFSQNDQTGGFLGLTLDFISLGLITFGGVTIGYYRFTSLDDFLSVASYVSVGAGIVVFIISKIVQLTRPTRLATEYNNKLAIKLNLSP